MRRGTACGKQWHTARRRGAALLIGVFGVFFLAKTHQGELIGMGVFLTQGG